MFHYRVKHFSDFPAESAIVVNKHQLSNMQGWSWCFSWYAFHENYIGRI